MSDISTKLTYLNTTKTQLKQMISYGYPLTNETFRQYVNGVFQAMINSMSDTLNPTWNNLPKLTTTPATSLSINNTIEAPMRMELGASELSQSGTPTPSSPQDIHSISGNNSVKVSGDNFFNSHNITDTATRTIESDGTIVLNNATSSQNGYHETGKKLGQLCPELKAGDTAYLYIDTDYYYNGTKRELIYCTASWNNGSSKTITEAMLNAVVVIYGGYQTTSHIKISITKGNTATTYTPYTGDTYTLTLGNIEYCKIGNYEDKFIRNSGKNLFTTDSKTSDTFTTYTKIDNNSFSYTCSGTWKGVVFIIPCKPNTEYRYSHVSSLEANMLYVEIKDNNTNTTLWGKYDGYLDSSFNSGTATALKISISNGTKSANTGGTIRNIQLEKGTAITTFEPYGTNEWYIKKNIGKIVLDGTEADWAERTNSGNVKQFYCSTTATDVLMGANNTQLCNYGTYNRSTFNWGSVGNFAILDNTKKFYICVDSNAVLSDFKTTIGSNNIIAYIQMNTPTYTQITGTLANELENIYNAMSKNGTTNISQVNNDLGFVISPTILEDLR